MCALLLSLCMLFIGNYVHNTYSFFLENIKLFYTLRLVCLYIEILAIKNSNQMFGKLSGDTLDGINAYIQHLFDSLKLHIKHSNSTEIFAIISSLML